MSNARRFRLAVRFLHLSVRMATTKKVKNLRENELLFCLVYEEIVNENNVCKEQTVNCILQIPINYNQGCRGEYRMVYKSLRFIYHPVLLDFC